MKKFLIIFTVVLTLALGSCAALIYGVFALIKGSEPYEMMFSQAAASEFVIEQIGSPVEAGLFVQGTVNMENASGDADLSFTVQGPDGEGRVYGTAVRTRSRWSLTSLYFVQGDAEVSLLDSP